jgi:hypothetical protein
MDGIELARLAHIAFGVVAFATYWTAATLRKGTRTHRLVGRSYMLAMLGIMATALPLAGAAFSQGQSATGAFLLYLVLITATACFLAWRAVRQRHSFSDYIASPYRALAWANLLAGVALFGLGVRSGAVLLYGMAVIGLALGATMLRSAAQPSAERGAWLRRHYAAIIGCGVATHIAFLSIGLRGLLPEALSGGARYVAWFGPIVAALIARRWLDRRYGRGEAGRRLAA